MNITIISFGSNMPDWVKEGYMTYVKRLPKHIKIHLQEISSKINKPDFEILSNATNDKDTIIALSSDGITKSSSDFAKELLRWQTTNNNVTFLIGGADGLSKKSLALASTVWSLSKLTFPHMLTRVILAEQIYRANCKNTNHPYFK